MTQEELSFKIAKADNWKKDVLQEIDTVNNLLQQFTDEIKVSPEEDDPIMNGLNKTGEALTQSYDTLISNFREAVKGVDQISEKWREALKEILASISTVVRNIGQGQ